MIHETGRNNFLDSGKHYCCAHVLWRTQEPSCSYPKLSASDVILKARFQWIANKDLNLIAGRVLS